MSAIANLTPLEWAILNFEAALKKEGTGIGFEEKFHASMEIHGHIYHRVSLMCTPVLGRLNESPLPLISFRRFYQHFLPGGSTFLAMHCADYISEFYQNPDFYEVLTGAPAYTAVFDSFHFRLIDGVLVITLLQSTIQKTGHAVSMRALDMFQRFLRKRIPAHIDIRYNYVIVAPQGSHPAAHYFPEGCSSYYAEVDPNSVFTLAERLSATSLRDHVELGCEKLTGQRLARLHATPFVRARKPPAGWMETHTQHRKIYKRCLHMYGLVDDELVVNNEDLEGDIEDDSEDGSQDPFDLPAGDLDLPTGAPAPTVPRRAPVVPYNLATVSISARETHARFVHPRQRVPMHASAQAPMVDADVVVLDADDLDTGVPLVERAAPVQEPVREPAQAVAVVAAQAQAQAGAAEPQPKKRKIDFMQRWLTRNE